MRKTMNVKDIRETAQRLLNLPDSDLDCFLSTYRYDAEKTTDVRDKANSEQAFRAGVAAMLEFVLFQTDSYAGYGAQEGQLSHFPNGNVYLTGDDTRRVYYVKR